jgi:hypothetical protein
MPAINMKKMTIHSTVAEPNSPTEVFLVENPPVARVVKEWQRASKPLRPASRSATHSAAVKPT